MGSSRYEKLSALDSSFLLLERESTPMHISAVSIFENGPLATEGGGLDIERIRKQIESRLPALPRYTKKLAFTPLARDPIWVDDESFDLDCHVRHVALPRPGSEASLRRLAGRLLSQPLDRNYPLWEMWIVEGLEDDRFAMISKVHHAMVDGAAGVNLLTLLLSPSPDTVSQPPQARVIRSGLSPLQLAIDESLGRLAGRVSLVRDAVGAIRKPLDTIRAATRYGAAIRDGLAAGAKRPRETALNRPISRHRRLEYCSLPVDEMKRVGAQLGGTLNDTLLTTVAGALGSFLGVRGEGRGHRDFRTLVPVNMRNGPDDMEAANNVSVLLVSLPVEEANPLVRFSRVRDETAKLKASHASEGLDLLMRMSDRTQSSIMTRLGAELALRYRAFNLVVTNIPGPQFPLFFLGSQMLAVYPQVPLMANQGLGVAVLSYDGAVNFGLVADRDVVPDLQGFARAIETSFDELRAASARPAGKVPPKKVTESSARANSGAA